MTKNKTMYICQNCDAKATHWSGQCLNCGEWNTLVETVINTAKSTSSRSNAKASSPIKLSQITTSETRRITSNINEFDRVLGGGFVKGQVILLAGTPGIGKSTILTQIAKEFSNKNVLYVCGEESVSQVKLRANRMGYTADNLLLLSETNVDNAIASIEHTHENEGLGLIIIDSIQTLFSEDLTGMAGSVGQVRGSTQKVIDIAKRIGVPAILVGHVTKEGTVAGPKVLEHMVDTVLYLEGDSQHMFRILKTSKNRFGAISEVGIFEMLETGMKEISNPSKLFLAEGKDSPSGTCTTVVMEGYRPLMFEIQALTVKTSFGYPRRTASGYSLNRLNVLIATLEKRCGLNLSNHDVYISVSGGYKVNEYSCDLAVCLAIASSLKDKPLKPQTAALGECALSGSVRKVPFQDARVKEATKMGYENVIHPGNVKSISQAISKSISK